VSCPASRQVDGPQLAGLRVAMGSSSCGSARGNVREQVPLQQPQLGQFVRPPIGRQVSSNDLAHTSCASAAASSVAVRACILFRENFRKGSR